MPPVNPRNFREMILTRWRRIEAQPRLRRAKPMKPNTIKQLWKRRTEILNRRQRVILRLSKGIEYTPKNGLHVFGVDSRGRALALVLGLRGGSVLRYESWQEIRDEAPECREFVVWARSKGQVGYDRECIEFHHVTQEDLA